VAARSKAWGCAVVRLLLLRVRIPPGGMDVSLVNIVCCTGRGLCYGPIPRPEWSYQVMCVCVCVCVCVVTGCDKVQQKPLHKQCVGIKRSD
jgi:hypothetical protein